MTQYPQDPVRPGGPRPEPHERLPREDLSATPARRPDRVPSGADAASPRPGTAPVTGQQPAAAPPTDPALDQPKKRGVSGTVWAALILGVIILILLLVFIIQNNVSTGFHYMAWEFSLPLGVAILLAAIAGALVMALVGSVRMFTLGHRVRRLEKERSRIKDALG